MRIAKLDVQGDAFAIVKSSIFILQCIESVHHLKESRTTFLCVIGLVELVRPPTASSRFGGTGVLWVLTGTHGCDLASRVR